MAANEVIQEEKSPHANSERQLWILVGVAIAIAIAFTTTGLILYSSGGSAQIDLSRPGYASKNSREFTKQLEDARGFSPTGEIDSHALEDFEKLLGDQVDEEKSINAFEGEPMSLEILGIKENPNH